MFRDTQWCVWNVGHGWCEMGPEPGRLRLHSESKTKPQRRWGSILPIPLSACIHSSFQQIFLNVFSLPGTGLDFGDITENRPDKN